MILRAERITFAYRLGQPVLREATLDVRPGIVTGLFGPNGSGKSTLLRCLNGALRPHAGEVLLDGRPIAAMSRREIARHVAVVPQDSPQDVALSAAEVVMLGRYAHWNAWGQESPEDAAIVRDCLTRLGIAELAGRPFSQLSGGERQRTVIARALAQQGSIVLMDEPNTHLDLAHQLDVYRLARTLAAQGQSVLIICHDLLVSPLLVDTAAVMDRGRIVGVGPVREVLTADVLRGVFATEVDLRWEVPLRVSAEFKPAGAGES